ncbi:Stk1 family PASTA domain-containing Ser/Thr kinase [Microbacterium flavescens]|uniref:Stk1 family PASTA domain-containing Ser/Thr kinase n=1 Tax=Microbacterium flavescens TaxID=69366 RepID=UPI001BDE51F0|nr:Stk1 family PASTA domain-containing Ser/Thr kinase [Microbacterium flavescens]
MSTSQQTDPLIGRLVDARYRVRARIARGGMATVYVATDLRLERRVALKVMHGHLSDDTVFQSRFIQEARAAARLADPHVVNVFDQGQDGDMAYLVMEYLPGITLRELLREQRRLTVPQAVSILDAILSGLAAAHRAGIVHRDVKPENVLLAEDGRIKIGDFGLARATTANTATGAQLLGTIAYLAPELVTRGMADARSDIYSLGILLYEMLTGEQPYKGEQPMQIAFQHATDSVPRPSVKNPGVPEPLDELVLWATEKNPDDRPSDAREMLDRLREIERELGITPNVTRTTPLGILRDDGAPSGDLTAVLPAAAGTGPTLAVEEVDNATALRRATRRRRTRGGWLIAVVILLAALAGGLGWWFGSGPGSMVVVADVAGMTFTEAQQRLAQDSLTAVEQGQNSLEVEAGRAIGTDPPSGSRLDKESEVTVLISLGPAEVQVESLVGKDKAEATGILDSHGIAVDGETGLFGDAAVDTVVGVTIHPRAGGDNVSCGEGCTVHEGDTATLSVSLGKLPAVRGLSVDDARGTLSDAGLEVADSVVEQPDEEIAAGLVIGTSEREGGGAWRPGDPVTLIVSTGPPLFPVPEVIGMTRDQAIQELEAAGFQVDYSALWAPFPDEITEVASSNPAAGSMLTKGTRVYIEITVSG